MYTGVIIEESLNDKSLLGLLKISSQKIEKVTGHHKTPWIEQWTLDTVEIPEEKAEVIAQSLSTSFDTSHQNSWYADFKNEHVHYVIFPNKVFKIDRSKPELYAQIASYGFSQGIPSYQLDFSPAIKDWKR